MREAPEEILIVDHRATRRVRRIVQAMNALEAKGRTGRRFKSLQAELDFLLSGNRRKGTTISVPRA